MSNQPNQNSDQDFPNSYMTDLKNQDPAFYLLVGFVAGVLITVITLNSDFLGREFIDSLAPEAIGIIFTVLILERLAERRAKREAETQLKMQLIRELGSRVNDVAKRAAEELRAEGWLKDGTLRGVKLVLANLAGANLMDADLQEANLLGANLNETILQGAKLNKANLTGNLNLHAANLKYSCLHDTRIWGANMRQINARGADFQTITLFSCDVQEANLEGVRLQKAKLRGNDFTGSTFEDANLEAAEIINSNFQNTNLMNTNLKGADLSGSNLENAKLEGYQYGRAFTHNDELYIGNISVSAVFDENTKLPNGKNWSLDIDILQFTDPNHPNFWRSDDPSSPAYRGTK